MLKKILAELRAALPWLLLLSAAHADERILAYDSTITVNRDGTLEVKEKIRVRAEGDRIRRGIYRDFPTTYPANDGRQIVVGFHFQSATRDAQPEPWRTEAHGNGIRIYLGSAAVELPEGEHTYEIVYLTDRQMGFFAHHDELFWNVTGNGWGFPIDHASARVLLPEAIPRADIKLEAYTGAQGSKGRDFAARIDDGAPFFETTSRLRPQEGLTIVAMWPKGFTQSLEMPAVPQPIATSSPGYDFARDAGSAGARSYGSPAEAFLHRDLPQDRRAVFIALTGLALLLGYYFFIWNRVGRDPPGRVIIPEYEMPPGQSAASMRYLRKMAYDNECFGAGILSLAVKGYLRIDQESGILGIGKTFTLRRESVPASGAKPLTKDEAALLPELFEPGDSLVLKKENYSVVRGARSAHESSLKQQFKSSFFKINGGWHFLGIAVSLVFIAISLSLPGEGGVWPFWLFTTFIGWITLGAVIAGFVANGLFGWLLKAPTVAGRAAMDHIEGFRRYLEVAEGEELKRAMAPPPPMTPQRYESYLPAALALGVEQRWAQKFARVLEIEAPNYHPTWYAGSNAFNAASIGSFSSQLGSSLSSAISSASVAPGSSSGGGGGGSSGGGGGGGGGGGW